MKPEEAILMIRNRIDTASEIAGKGTDGKAFEDMEMAIEALKEIQQYREIGNVEECREAVERQKPVKSEDYDENLGYFVCPSCGCTIMADEFSDHKFCLCCGQSLLWKKSKEESEGKSWMQ